MTLSIGTWFVQRPSGMQVTPDVLHLGPFPGSLCPASLPIRTYSWNFSQVSHSQYMTNYADSEDILIGQQKIEKVTEFKYLGQTTHLKDTTKEEIYARIRAAWSGFGKNKEILQDKQLPFSLKKQVMDQCILPTMTYGCQTWSLNKQMTNKLRTAQRAMERKMLDLKLKDKIPCAEIRKRTKIIDIIEYTLKQKWK